MDSLTSILEEEFALAFTVKDEKALRRSLTLLTGNMVAKEEYHREHDSLSSDIKLIATRMEEGFKRMDARFEAVDLRFEANDKRLDTIDTRFNRITGLISLGFITITVLITVFQFLG